MSKRLTLSIMTIALSIIFAAIPLSTCAGTLAWDSSSGIVDGYKIYWGTDNSEPSDYLDVGNVTSYELHRLPLYKFETYYLSVSAYNEAGESPRCEPVVYDPGDITPPSPPKGLWAD